MNTTASTAAPAPNANWKNCRDCGALVSKNAEICPKCGAGQGGGSLNKTVLLLLTFFGGNLGLHRFYLRKTAQGVFSILFFWTGIPGLIAFVEFFVYAFTSQERLSQKYQVTASGTLIAIIVAAIFGFVFIVGILAAIAIPQYRDYVAVSKTTAALDQVEPLRLKVEQHITKAGAIPAEAAEIPGIAPVAIPAIASAQVENNSVIVIRFDAAMNKPVAGTTIELSPYIENGRVAWRCSGGDLPAKYRPLRCRGK